MDYGPLWPLLVQVVLTTFVTTLLCTVAAEATR
jgi:hypothetical protein